MMFVTPVRVTRCRHDSKPGPGTALNIGPGETLVGIEILDAKHVFGAEELPDLVVENVPLAVSV